MSQHIIVTGAGTGIGKAIALRLAADGASVSLVARDVERLESVASQCASAAAFGCDIRQRDQVERAFDAAVERFGPVRALVANSGIGGANAPGPDDRFYELVGTNLKGTYHCLRAAEARLVQDGEARHLVVISSILARIGVPGYTGYCASKAGLLGLVRALAAELAPNNVQVNAICPGWVNTAMAREGLEGIAAAMGVSFEAARADQMSHVPLGRMSEPEDIAGMVSWLVSKDARGVTGQALDMNGGAFMS